MLRHLPVRGDLRLVHHAQASYDQAFLLSDRATNRYWHVGPVQFEMARVFSRKDLDWSGACAALRSSFDEEVTDDEITDTYRQFRDLGLLELSPELVDKRALSLAAYRRALRILQVTSRSAAKAPARVRAYLQLVNDGRHTPTQLASFALELRQELPQDPWVAKLINAFHRAMHAEKQARDNAHVPAVLRWMRVSVPLFDPNAQIDRWLPRLRFMFSWWFVLLTVFVSLWGFLTYIDRAKEVHQRLGLVSGNLVLLFSCTVLMLVVHEYAHALTCRHFGGEVHEIGIIVFLFFIPAAYCDVSDAHLFARRRRKLLVTFAGTYSTFVLASLGALLWSRTVPTATLNHMGLVLMATGYATVLTNLNPLLPLDGYFFLADWLGIDNLRDRAPEYAKAYLAALLTGKPRPEETPRNKRVFFAYFLVGSMYQIFYMLLSLGFGWLLLVRGGTRLGFIVFALLIYLFYLRTYWLKLRALYQQSRTKTLFAWVMAGAAAVGVLIFVPFPSTVDLPVVVRELARVPVVSRDGAVLDAVLAPNGGQVREGQILFRLGTERGVQAVTAPAGGTFVWSKEWVENVAVAAGQRMGEVVTGYVVEGPLPERYVANARDATRVEVAVVGQPVSSTGPVAILARPTPIVRVGIVAADANALTLQDGVAARLRLDSQRTISLWRRLWGVHWDRVIMDVWRVW